MPYEDTEQKHNEAGRIKQRDQDTYDHQNEVAERDTGRLKRFMVNGERTPETQEKKERDKLNTLTALELLLQNPEYAALYNETKGLIADAMGITEVELELAHQRLETLADQRGDMRNDANHLADGRLVFKDENGNVVTENDEIITDQVLLDGIVWKDNAPTYEEFVENRDAINGTLDTIDALTRYQIEVLGAAKVRLEDEDNPPSKEELEDIKRDVHEQAPDIVKVKLESTNTAMPVDPQPHEIKAFTM